MYSPYIWFPFNFQSMSDFEFDLSRSPIVQVDSPYRTSYWCPVITTGVYLSLFSCYGHLKFVLPYISYLWAKFSKSTPALTLGRFFSTSNHFIRGSGKAPIENEVDRLHSLRDIRQTQTHRHVKLKSQEHHNNPRPALLSGFKWNGWK